MADAGKRLIVPLSASYNAEDFDCGEAARNQWLCTRALGNQSSDDTRTYVSIENSRVVGFYAVTISSIVRSNLPGSMRRNAPDPVGCVLLAQLGVDLAFQNQGLGRRLVLHAMGQAVRISEIGGGRLFAVHPAKPEMLDYYERFGFAAMDVTPPLMVMLMKKVRATLTAVAEVQEADRD